MTIMTEVWKEFEPSQKKYKALREFGGLNSRVGLCLTHRFTGLAKAKPMSQQGPRAPFFFLI